MFQGNHKHKIDRKGRLTIPVEFREELEAGAILSIGVDECFYIYPKDQWDEMAQSMASTTPSRSKIRRINRLVFGNAFSVNLDAQGRVVIPPSIEDTAFSVGMNTHLEVWSEKAWLKELELLKQEAFDLFETREERS